MLDKKSLLRVSGIVPLAVILVVGSYGVSASYEHYLRKWLEEKSSLAFGAKIDIQSLSVHPLQGLATLKKIQITNPRSPLTNIFEIDQISVNFSLGELLKKKLDISLLDIKGLKINTSRIASGSLEDLGPLAETHPVLWEKTNSGAYGELRNQVKQGPLKYLSQITTGAYTPTKLPNLHKTLTSIKHLEELNKSFEKSHREWNVQSNVLPTSTQINQWQSEIAKWNSKPRDLASLSETENRKKLLSLLTDKHKNLKEKLTLATKTVEKYKSEMEKFSSLLDGDIEAVKKELSLPSAEENDLSFSLFGLHVIGLLEKISYWSEAYESSNTTLMTQGNLRLICSQSNGHNLYHYLNLNTLPSLYIQKGRLEDNVSTNGKNRNISFLFTDFMKFPNFYDRKSTVSLKATIPEFELEDLALEIEMMNNDGNYQKSFQFSVDSFAIENANLRSTSDFELKIAGATGRISAHGKMTGPNLEAEGRFETTGTKFAVKSQFQPFEEVLETLTKYRTNLKVIGMAKKTGDQVELKIESDLGKSLALAISDTFKKQLAQIDDTLKTHILDSLFPLRQSFDEKLQDAENISLAQMRNTVSELENLLSSARSL
jgi:uncharacterized protein (TIGR03545 family)